MQNILLEHTESLEINVTSFMTIPMMIKLLVTFWHIQYSLHSCKVDNYMCVNNVYKNLFFYLIHMVYYNL